MQHPVAQTLGVALTGVCQVNEDAHSNRFSGRTVAVQVENLTDVFKRR